MLVMDLDASAPHLFASMLWMVRPCFSMCSTISFDSAAVYIAPRFFGTLPQDASS